ncbi:hypothetical protein [Microbacterium paraoxydans]|uniref:hypothetical protein n=1 Tax=Microbacterium paraoxydans TaxID=199592 RepID=UPI001C2B953B|nr:hypothetical protein [Microbacterium paraoxydans]QXE28548.1 hypothetical protein IZR02_08985 [Microbacterium paraoxydans]
MSESDNDLRISVAEIKGMLTATLARHDQRLDQHEDTIKQHEGRLNEKGKTIARHDERLLDLEEDSAAQWGRVMGVLALLVSAGVALWNIITP